MAARAAADTVRELGWTPAALLRRGDVLSSHDGERVLVESVVDTGRMEAVCNLEVEGCHTYFVGGADWGFSVWAHNAGCTPEQLAKNYANGKNAEKGLAALLRQAGYTVAENVYRMTPFGKRFIDILVSKGDKVLGAIEVKTGGSRYTAIQRAKDLSIRINDGITTTLVRF